jgi:hypothetical protein
MTRFELAPSDAPERSGVELARLQAEIAGMGPAFCNMAIRHAKDVLASIPVLKAAMPGVDLRQADNFATLLAGFFVGMNRRTIAAEEAAELVEVHCEPITDHAEAQDEDDAQECLNALLGYRCRVEVDGSYIERSVGQLLGSVLHGANPMGAAEVLGQHGVMA